MSLNTGKYATVFFIFDKNLEYVFSDNLWKYSENTTLNKIVKYLLHTKTNKYFTTRNSYDDSTIIEVEIGNNYLRIVTEYFSNKKELSTRSISPNNPTIFNIHSLLNDLYIWITDSHFHAINLGFNNGIDWFKHNHINPRIITFNYMDIVNMDECFLILNNIKTFHDRRNCFDYDFTKNNDIVGFHLNRTSQHINNRWEEKLTNYDLDSLIFNKHFFNNFCNLHKDTLLWEENLHVEPRHGDFLKKYYDYNDMDNIGEFYE